MSLQRQWGLTVAGSSSLAVVAGDGWLRWQCVQQAGLIFVWAQAAQMSGVLKTGKYPLSDWWAGVWKMMKRSVPPDTLCKYLLSFDLEVFGTRRLKIGFGL